jgi:hypothetical protein
MTMSNMGRTDGAPGTPGVADDIGADCEGEAAMACVAFDEQSVGGGSGV